MISLPWSTSWFQAGMSVWAIACRIAFVSTAPLRTVLKHLSAANERWRSPLWFSSAGSEAHLASELGLTEAALSATFLGPPPERLVDRQHVCLRLRWCPTCMERWYHSAQFQDTRLDRCPVHGCLLIDRCPHCDRAIDPLGELAWFCHSCKRYLTQPPADWLDDFERVVRAVPRQSLAEEGGATELSTLFVPASDDIKAPDVFDSFRYMAWRQQFMFEDACAIWDTLGQAHRGCVHDEPQAGLNQYSAVEFNCPVAGALLHAYGDLDVVAEVRRGWYVWHATVTSARGLTLPLGLPDWVVPAVTRAAGRRAVLEDLKSFRRAADLGRKKTFGSAVLALTPQMGFTPEGAFLQSVVPESALLKAIERAERHCPKSADRKRTL